jgi:NAD dependent epimerase/dehydratase family enzyme
LTSVLVKAIQKATKPPTVFISGSAVGYYPTSLSEEFDEDYKGLPAKNFSGEVCQKWEGISK